jgi:hypothetical protein
MCDFTIFRSTEFPWGKEVIGVVEFDESEQRYYVRLENENLTTEQTEDIVRWAANEKRDEQIIHSLSPKKYYFDNSIRPETSRSMGDVFYYFSAIYEGKEYRFIKGKDANMRNIDDDIDAYFLPGTRVKFTPIPNNIFFPNNRERYEYKLPGPAATEIHEVMKQWYAEVFEGIHNSKTHLVVKWKVFNEREKDVGTKEQVIEELLKQHRLDRNSKITYYSYDNEKFKVITRMTEPPSENFEMKTSGGCTLQ